MSGAPYNTTNNIYGNKEQTVLVGFRDCKGLNNTYWQWLPVPVIVKL